MLVYRVETPSGVGPFSNDENLMSIIDIHFYDIMIGEHLNEVLHPMPPQKLITPEYRFGCDSMDALRTWFSNAMLDMLHRYGYIVKVFNIKTVERVSEGQVAFKIRNAVEVETHPLSILA